MYEKGRHDLREHFSNELNSLKYFIRTPVSQAFRQMQKQLSATAFVVMLCNRATVYREKIRYQ
ncbi:hypothetical protein C1O12_25135 [Enterobacter hormaechei]|uniref:Uncharacterized protein n=1 Tax=Enterobacter hormaechei TaxID=158836 RepID=A0A855VEK2_9ENTR|nr:hypothetical protein C1O12_25135 [Enterobacter hormaechei]